MHARSYFILAICICLIVVVVVRISIITCYSKLNWIGSMDISESERVVRNPEGRGRYMLITNQEARKINRLRALMVKFDSEKNDLLLVFRGAIGNRGRNTYLLHDKDLNSEFANNDDVINVYAISWRRLNLPPGIAVER